MSQLDSKGVVGTTHLLKGQLIFVLCVCGSEILNGGGVDLNGRRNWWKI